MSQQSKIVRKLSEFTLSPVQNILATSHIYYQPNFILIDKPSSKREVQIFSDIIPLYKSYQELSTIIVTSLDELSNFILLSKTFVVCLISLINIFLQSTVYNLYTLSMQGYELVLSLPENYTWLKSKFSNLISTLYDSQTRELWWLEMRIDYRAFTKKINQVLNIFWLVAQKFYLVVVIGASIGILNVISFSSSLASQPSSFLSKFIQNYSLVDSNYTVNAFSESLESISEVSLDDDEVAPVQKIIQYIVGSNENIDDIAKMYGISVKTVAYNNSITTDQVVEGQKLYIPWVDGYIYNTTSDTSPEDLSNLYSIPKEAIVNENVQILNTFTNKFAKDNLVLIPTSDFDSITKTNQLIASQKLVAEREQNTSKRQTVLAQNSIKTSKNTYVGQVSGDQRANGFIMPASGYYSRSVGSTSSCGFSGGHHGCDIATYGGAKPPIYAVQKGSIAKVGYETGGYGNFVIINHGDGLATLYAHLEEVYVKQGDVVPQGQAIGQMGATGKATGVHLHFEVRVDGVQVNPKPYLP